MAASSNVESFVSAALYLKSRELTPAAISERVGLKPTSTHLKGEPVTERHPEVGDDPDNYFILEVRRTVHRTEARFTDDSAAQLLKAAIEELLDKIEPAAARLNQMHHQVSATLMCAYVAMPSPQWFTLSDTLLHRLAALNLSVKIFFSPFSAT
jgi:hypothetical protein